MDTKNLQDALDLIDKLEDILADIDWNTEFSDENDPILKCEQVGKLLHTELEYREKKNL